MDPVDNVKFGVLDYFFFTIVFILSMGIGLYYAVKARGQVSTVDDYLLGGRKMGILPVCCSLVATVLSGTAIIGIPAEIYAYGTYTWISIFADFIVAVSMHFIFFEVFHGLNLTSAFKYLEMRFNRKVRLLASGIFLFCGLLVLPLTVYIPALTFERVTGVNIYVTVIILSIFCASYTAMGGFKGVIWTDVVQLLLILTSGITVLVVGTQNVGGLEAVYDAANRGGRIVFVNVEKLNSRSSWLAMIVSYPVLNIFLFGLNQAILQRYLSLPSIRKMKITQWITLIPLIFIYTFTTLMGIVMYANYETCDPTTAGLIRRMDQMLPHFIIEKATLFQGLSGIFIAGIFSAGLSTTSSYLNAMSGILYADFISLRYRNLANKATDIMKITVLLLGLIQIAFVFLIEKMGMITQIAMQCYALQGTTMVTLFGLGILVPRANSMGAIAGALSSIIGILVLILGSLNNKAEPTLPLRTDGCDSGLNITTSNIPEVFKVVEDVDDTFWLFKLNFQYYALVGTVIGMC
ncbi:hypothetical protein DMENIID0001_056900 [Sergentomyia squamirostris]